jgi:tRNA threonylcarbamoyl adenosine modification protein (Sua5/YciO/YrdC/YwlC family)
MRLRVDGQRPDPRKLAPAVDALTRGEVIIYPTDTGYAFGCSMSSKKGIATLRRLKGIHEKHWKPLTMLVSSINELGRYGVLDNHVFRTVRRILPGPYTIVLRATKEVPKSMRNREHEVGMRMPDDRVCDHLLAELGGPLLTGSLTPGEEAPELEEVELFEMRYANDVSVVVDAGPMWPEPSTVLRYRGDGMEVLREGQGEIPA